MNLTEKYKKYQSPELGEEISCVMFNPNEDFFTDNSRLEKMLKETLLEKNFTILNTSLYAFCPQGCTITFTLGESHLAVHTYPEYKSIYVNMYSCRGPNDALPVIRSISQKLKPAKVAITNNTKVPASSEEARKLGFF